MEMLDTGPDWTGLDQWEPMSWLVIAISLWQTNPHLIPEAQIHIHDWIALHALGWGGELVKP